jgi:hypothetical protein
VSGFGHSSGRTEEKAVNRPLEVFTAAVSAIRGRLLVVAGQSERTLLLGTILLVSALSVLRGFVLARYFSIDVLSALVVHVPEDCLLDWPMQVGRHCFSDYSLVVSYGMRPDPWDPFPLPDLKVAHNNYSAAGMLPHMLFGFLGNWLHAPKVGLLGYLLALTIACLTPAVWAAWGARGLERLVVFIALAVAAIPLWTALDRGNAVGFAVPITLAFLVALCRQRWGLAAIMVVLAALVKPQFVVLAVALFAARQRRWGGFTLAGAAITNLAAYLLWPRGFPTTIMQSIHEALGFGSSGSSASSADVFNMSFAEGLLMIPDDIKAGETGGKIPAGFIAGPRSLLGYVVLIVVVVSVMALGRRIQPVMAGIVLLATASLFPSLVPAYYLVFAVPIAALIARNPYGPLGSGIFDRPETLGGRRRAVGLCVSLAAALTIAQMVPFGPQLWSQKMGGEALVAHIVGVLTSVRMAPVLWLIACAAIVVSYARKPTPSLPTERGANPEGSQDIAADNALRRTAVQTTES